MSEMKCCDPKIGQCETVNESGHSQEIPHCCHDVRHTIFLIKLYFFTVNLQHSNAYMKLLCYSKKRVKR